MHKTTRFAAPLLLAWALSLSGCSFAPPLQSPEVVTEIPEHFEHADTLGAYTPLKWWSVFEDPVLDRLIDSTLTSNLDLIEAVARVSELEATYRIERSALFPSINAAADASYNDQPANTGFGAQFSALTGGEGDAEGGAGEEVPTEQTSGPGRIGIESYSASVSMSYEIDFWGRVKNSTRAALREYLATTADLDAARLAVINQTITTYFEVVDLRRRIAFSLETIDVLSERVSRTQERYDSGLASSFELYSILQDYRNTQANLPLLERQLTDAEGRLAVIVGEYAGQLDYLLGGELTPQRATESIPVGLPAELLNQRPDVQAAAQRLEAARYQIGARKAEQYPTISPTGTLGLQSAELKDLFDLSQWYLNIAGSITAPLIQGGRLKANVDAAEARYIQVAAAYTRTILTAYQEAESALAGMEEEEQRFEFFTGQRQEALSAVNLQSDRFENGVGTYLDYLDALRTFYNVETNLSSAARDLALARLSVHQALGGGWTEQDMNPSLQMVQQDLIGIEE